MDILLTLIASAGTSALITAALVWLSKQWISERLKGAIKHEYDEKLETHKSQLKSQSDLEAERLRSQLSIAAVEHQVRFSGLHTKRADVIAQIYSLLVQAYWDASSFVSPIELAGEPDKKQKYVSAMNSLADLFRFFDKNKIYLPEQLCLQLEQFVQGIRRKAIEFGTYVRYEDRSLSNEQIAKKHDAWGKAWDYFEKEVPEARSSLERELRLILGAQ